MAWNSLLCKQHIQEADTPQDTVFCKKQIKKADGTMKSPETFTQLLHYLLPQGQQRYSLDLLQVLVLCTVFFPQIDMCCISTGVLERREIKPHPDHDFMLPNTCFVFNFTLWNPALWFVYVDLILLVVHCCTQVKEDGLESSASSYLDRQLRKNNLN